MENKHFGFTHQPCVLSSKLDTKSGRQTQDAKLVPGGAIGLRPFCLDFVRHGDMCEHGFHQMCPAYFFLERVGDSMATIPFLKYVELDGTRVPRTRDKLTRMVSANSFVFR